MEIGGFFPYQPVGSEPNNYVWRSVMGNGVGSKYYGENCA